ncbi:hypothetical protein [Pseudomonas moraviensis]|uniref:Uncharacterized protein n=1 Tax=Pseudomonas moraviensis TaxID=321662 RepID=A0A7Z0AWE8_9PSED|nr:hypothetical protein [Pseudomonas moraviensis]NYH11167.1 hypothetical protein [Pseudomonas moraviensis]
MRAALIGAVLTGYTTKISGDVVKLKTVQLAPVGREKARLIRPGFLFVQR